MNAMAGNKSVGRLRRLRSLGRRRLRPLLRCRAGVAVAAAAAVLAWMLFWAGAGQAPGVVDHHRYGGSAPAADHDLAGRAEQLIAAARAQGQTRLDASITVVPRLTDQIISRVRLAGGSVHAVSRRAGLLVVSLPLEAAAAVGSAPGVISLSGDSGAVVRPAQSLLPGVDEAPAGNLTMADIVDRQQLNLSLTRVPDLWERSGATGAGTIIAIIDTGIDPSHPALSGTPGGAVKVTDWVDMTGRGEFVDRMRQEPGTRMAEGDVRLDRQVGASGNFLRIDAGSVHLGPVRSQSNVYKYGWLDVAGLSDGGDGAAGRLLVVAVDSRQAGRYDTVLVDSTGSLDLRQDVPLALFRSSGTVARIPVAGAGSGDDRSDERWAGLVINQLAPNGQMVNFGFDGNGHGTHVAGLSAGHDPAGFQGAAPSASLIAIKALSARGEGSWSQIAAGVAYAVEAGADVLVISISGMGDLIGTGASEARYLQAAARSCACMIVLAAGNDGPGLGTVIAPGDDRYTLTVGAYTSPEIVAADYGLRIQGEGIPHYSGVGPRSDGSMGPVVVAPGAAVGPVPNWDTPAGYRLMEGTSMAAPQAAGIVALLTEAARHQGIAPEPDRLRQSLQTGARSLERVSVLEQGYGLLDALAAWEAFNQPAAPVGALSYPGSGTATSAEQRGLYARSDLPANLYWTARNAGGTGRLWQVEAAPGWMASDREGVAVSSAGSRRFQVNYEWPAETGLHTGWLRLYTAGRTPVAAALHTVIRPEQPFDPAASGSLTRNSWVDAGSRNRLFLDIPDGTRTLDVRVAHGGGSGPRLYVMLYDGSGRLRAASTLSTGSGGRQWQGRFHLPGAGVWELVVVGAAGVGPPASSGYTVAVTGSRVHWEPVSWAGSFPESPQSQAVTIGAVGGEFRGSLVPLGPGRELPHPSSVILPLSSSDVVQHEVVIPTNTSLAEFVVQSASGRSLPFNLYLFRRGAGANSLSEVAQSDGDRNRPTVLTVKNPAAGRYLAWVEGPGGSADSVELRYRLQSGDGRHMGIAEPDIHIAPGERTAQRAVTVGPPSAVGRSHSVVGVHDQQWDAWLGGMTLHLSRGEPQLLLSATGTAGPYYGGTLLTVRDAVTLAPVNAEVTVAGRSYRMIDGRVRLPASAVQSGSLQVRVEHPAYAMVDQVLAVSPPVPGDYPAEGGQAVRALRRKIVQQQHAFR